LRNRDISQNGNAYEEGLNDGWNPIRAYWQDPSETNRKTLRAFLMPQTTPLAVQEQQRPLLSASRRRSVQA
jgi:hypothetical protein